MKKVAILLSTYNGEKYIEEQIQSLLKQTYKNIEIYIRDDGSKDSTPDILKKYENQNKIKLYLGDNKGFTDSFFELLSYPKDVDYYAFCDQDDVWYENKIERAVGKLEKLDNTKPLLYASNFECYDSKMNFLKKSGYKDKKSFFYKSIVECIAPGMTMCINKTARDMVINNKPNVNFFHDWWICLVCSGLGTVIYDNEVTVKYRIHENNVTVAKKGLMQNLKRKCKQYLGNEFYRKIKNQLINFEEIYENQLKEEDLNILKLFTNKKYIFKNQFKKVFYPKRFKDNLINELSLRFMFLIGKL